MTCESCGDKPKKCNKDFTKAVVEINNPGQITLMRKVTIPASMGDDTTVPPVVGKYKNVLLYYEANQKSYLYSSDGIPTQLVNGMTDYEAAINLPQINNHTLIGNKTGAQLDLQDKLTAGANISIDSDNVISAVDTTYGPATDTEIGLVKPGDGLEVSSDGTLNTVKYIFDTVADMKAATDLTNGDVVKTLGYHAKGDYGEAWYTITDAPSTADEKRIIAIGTDLYAILNLDSKTLKPEQFGCYGDGTHDDTDNLQSAINYSINNNLTLELNGNYLVTPTLQSDTTYVCLKYEKRNTGQQFVGTELRFNRGAKIKTSYNDGECTLLRVESRNARITNGTFEGVQGKTNLLAFSRIDKSNTNYDGYNLDNLVDNCVFRYGKNAISMEGASYYNKFTNDRIYNCNIGILLQMTYLEKQGLEQTASVNRNDFVDVNMNLITDWGIKIEYGDTNKFVNVDLEGCANGIYIDDPKLHSSDFPIAPLYNTATNKFVNIMMESITTTTWYNNAVGTSIINTSTSWDNHVNFVVQPQDFLGGYDDTTSIEKVNGIIKSKDAVAYTDQKQWNYLIPADTGVRGLYDIKVQSGSVINKNRQTFQFDSTKNTNIDTLTYDASKPVVKSLGGIIFMTGCLFIIPTSTSTPIKLYFPDNLTWMKGINNIYQNTNYGQPGFIVPYYNGGTLSKCCCTIREEFIELAPIDGGAWHPSWNVFKLNLSWFSADSNS